MRSGFPDIKDPGPGNLLHMPFLSGLLYNLFCIGDVYYVPFRFMQFSYSIMLICQTDVQVWYKIIQNRYFTNHPQDGAHVQKITNGGCSLYVPVRSEFEAAVSRRGFEGGLLRTGTNKLHFPLIVQLGRQCNYTTKLTFCKVRCIIEL